MNIGNLLKKYRISQGKSQNQFVETILTQSYYAKVERNVSQITAQNLIKLLEKNKIDISNFFKQLASTHDDTKHELKIFSKLMTEAYYSNNLTQMHQIKSLIESSALSEKEKENQLLIISGFIELMDNEKAKVDYGLQDKLKNKIFDIPDFNQNKLMLYCDFMSFYDLESNRIITQTILKQYENTTDVSIQEFLLAIITNLLILSIKENDLGDTEIFINYADQIKTVPKLFFYKLALSFFENIINYKLTQKDMYQIKAKNIIEAVKSAGMNKYGVELAQYMKKYS